MRRVIPVVFRTPRALRALNVVAVGCAIAAMTTAVCFSSAASSSRWSLIVGLPSLLVGTVWAAVLRMRSTVGARRVPVGWVLSVPFAALNGALACGLLFVWDEPNPLLFLSGAVIGATFGAVVWVPGLLGVLALFGVPIAWAQRLARRGLAGEERGEILVGAACVLLAGLALAIAYALSRPLAGPTFLWAQLALFHAFVAGAAGCGASAVVVAARRELRRRRFVARVERHEEPDLRVESRASGKVLVRVEPWVESYRVAPPEEEELVELDGRGRAVRALR